MNRRFNAETAGLVCELVKNVTQYEEGSEILKYCEKYAINTLEAADTMVFFNKREMDAMMNGLSGKLVFHGFFTQAEDLLAFYRRYIPEKLPESELNLRINVVKFVTALCERPTEYLLHHPFDYKSKEEPEEIIDWPAYLNEGIERWSPTQFHDESDEWSEDESGRSSLQIEGDGICLDKKESNLQEINITQKEQLQDFSNAREFLVQNIQSTWFTQDLVIMLPESRSVESRAGLAWEHYIEKKTFGLLPKSNTLSEYIVLREIIWQFFVPVSAFVFKLNGNTLIVRDDVTISSIRQPVFEHLLQSILAYINYFHELNKFYKSICYSPTEVVNTYQNYACSLYTNIIQPIMSKLVDLERKIVQQDSIVTLFTVADTIKSIFKPAGILQQIHNEAILDFTGHSKLDCASHLISRLHHCLVDNHSKLEQDLILTLYLDSLSKYLSMIDNLLRNGALCSDTEEFVITQNNNNETYFEFNKQFFLKKLKPYAKVNPIIRTICIKVLEIGKNIGLLCNMKKHSLIFGWPVNLYDVLKQKFLEAVKSYFDQNSLFEDQTKNMIALQETNETQYDSVANPIQSTMNCLNTNTQGSIIKLHNFNDLNVDTTDGFLMSSFSCLLNKETPTENAKNTLYEEISETTKSIFPSHEMLVTVFSDILNEKHLEYGTIVKKIFLEDFKLFDYMDVLEKLFLFKEDIIFPFYRRFFELFNRLSSWGNNIWLSSHLQDIIIDYQPDLYERVSVLIPKYWKQINDPIKACEMLEVHFKIDWPINLIITEEQMKKYQEIFTFILLLKYALYTLNQLSFSNLVPRRDYLYVKNFYKNIPIRLMSLRFFLINHFTSLQHFVFGYVMRKCKGDFQNKVEKGCSFEELVDAHKEYVDLIHESCMEIQNFSILSNGYSMLIYNVVELKKMWHDILNISESTLATCESCCQNTCANLESLICPRMHDDSSDED